MSDNEKMTKILAELMTITDTKCLKTIQTSAFNRKKDLTQNLAQKETASWIIGDDVQLLPEHQGKRPYGATGKIKKINKVRIKVDFGNHRLYTVPKTMLIKV